VTEGLHHAAGAERISERLASLNSFIKEKTGYNFVVTSHPVYSFMVKYDADARRMTVGGYLGLIPLRDGTYLDDKRPSTQNAMIKHSSRRSEIM
jgi:hypothetical protein